MNFYTTNEVAQILNMHPHTITRWCGQHKLTGHKANGRWHITAESVETMQRRLRHGAVCTDCGKRRQPGQTFPLCTDCQVKRSNGEGWKWRVQ